MITGNEPKDNWYDADKGEMITGLTIRQHFAALAMQSMVSGITKFRTETGMEDIIINRPKDVAEISCVYADALIAELNKPNN